MPILKQIKNGHSKSQNREMTLDISQLSVPNSDDPMAIGCKTIASAEQKDYIQSNTDFTVENHSSRGRLGAVVGPIRSGSESS